MGFRELNSQHSQHSQPESSKLANRIFDDLDGTVPRMCPDAKVEDVVCGRGRPGPCSPEWCQLRGSQRPQVADAHAPCAEIG